MMFRLNHFNALMRKNWITWKRTPIESSLEILISVLLMVILAIARLFIVPKSISSQGLLNLKHTLYPIASPSATGEWVLDSSNKGMTFVDEQMQPLMRHTNFTNWGQMYVPMMDPLGPYLFFPSHCYGSEDKFQSPIIGYVATGSSFEQDLIAQLELLFQNQQQLEGNNTAVESKLQDFKKTIQNLAMNGDPLKAESFKHQGQTKSQLGNFTLQSFKNHEEFDLYIQDPTYGSREKPGICFGFKASESFDKRSYDLELMFNDQMPSEYISLPNQRLPASLQTQFLPLFNDYVLYSWNGFGYMQNWAANTILKRHTTPDASIVCVTVPFQSKDFIKDDFEFFLRIGLISIIYLMYMPPVYRTVYRIVQEKESKAKETMLMMGMSELSYWCSWFCYYTLVNTLITTLSWLMLAFVIFKHSDVWLVWLVLWLFGQSLFGLILTAQSMFTRARAAAYVTTSLYFGLALLESLITSPTTSMWSKVIASLSPTVALSQTINVLVVFETSGVGSHPSNMQVQFMNYSVQIGLMMICLDIIVWYLFGAYLEVVLPQAYGKRRVFFGNGKDLRIQDKTPSNDVGECFETTPQDVAMRECLVIEGLKKTYENGFQAVNNLCCKMFKDQIFCLLGHNGAGKTSTISILTGLIEPSSYGKLEVFGVDIMKQQHRQFLGVCPQHDILFELLTPKEHLEIFYEFKSSQGLGDVEIEEMIKDVGLSDKVNTVACQLSGGNKRKLSVAIALIGGSKFVLLDEPTSGMDVHARHQLWSMLRKHKQGRIILMTTHYMDEADILGDRIGIMHQGKLSCLGSSLFLKTKFGVGYNLCISKGISSGLKQFVANYFGNDANCLSETNSQLVYQLLHEQSPRFERFFKELDQKTELAQGYTLQITTLEEVFLKIGHLEDPLEQKENTQLAPSPEIEIKGKDDTFLNNLRGVLFKRTSVIRRNRRLLFKEVFYPAFIMFYAITVGQFIPMQRSVPKILSPVNIAANQHMVFSQLQLDDTWQLEIVENPFQPFEARKQQKPSLLTELALKLWSKLPGKPVSKRVSIRSHDPVLELLRQQFVLDHVPQSPLFRDLVFEHGKQLSDPHLYAGLELVDAKDNQYQFIAHVNLTSQEVAAVYPQVMYEAILKAATGDSQFEFKVRSTPYPIPSYLSQVKSTVDSGRMVFLTAVAQACIVTLICSSYVLERTNGLKHFQTIAGMRLGAYWTANFIFDLITMEVTAVTTCMLFYYYQLPYQSAQVSYLLYPFAVLPYTYVMSFCFASEASSQSIVMFVIFMSILTLSTVGFVLRSVEGFEWGSDLLHWVLRMVSPNYCLGSSIYLNTSADLLSSARAARGISLSQDQWALINVSGDILCLIFHAMFWPLVLYFIEKGQHLANDHPIACNDAIKVQNFRKVFKQKRLCRRSGQQVVAVNNLCFQVEYGESFCLLGVNGAGKSTTFKALTREIAPTRGKVAIAGHWSDASRFGYCPQQNLIFDTMTVEEHLRYFAAIRGVPEHLRVLVIDKAIQDLGLHRNKEAGTLSGGNKRKLCVAMAVISNTPIVLLDEPSAGMDPDSRKLMWNVVKQIKQRKRSAVFFTTHSIEEAEALSTKIGIMVKGGEFKCIGTSQEIKAKFGFGYVIDCKLAGSESQLLTYLCQNFGQVDCLERQGSFIRLLLPKNNLNVSFGHIFGLMESYKSQNLIFEYSVTQSTLEQVFQAFANLQEKTTHWRLGDDLKLIQF